MGLRKHTISWLQLSNTVEDNGVPFDRTRLEIAQQIMQEDIDNAVAKLYEFPEGATI